MLAAVTRYSVWATMIPDRPFLVGSMLGGPGAYLALGSLGLPLALAVTLQLMAPRGSREGLRTRLGNSGQGSLVLLLCGLLLYPAVISTLARLKAGQRVQSYGPASHLYRLHPPRASTS